MGTCPKHIADVEEAKSEPKRTADAERANSESHSVEGAHAELDRAGKWQQEIDRLLFKRKGPEGPETFAFMCSKVVEQGLGTGQKPGRTSGFPGREFFLRGAMCRAGFGRRAMRR